MNYLDELWSFLRNNVVLELIDFEESKISIQPALFFFIAHETQNYTIEINN